MWQIWLIVAGIFFVAEIFTTGFLVFWFGLSALIVTFLSLVISDLVVLTSIFLVLSVILIFATRPFVNKFLQTKSVNTNVFSLVGKHGIVIVPLDGKKGTGQIKINGEIWSAEELNKNDVPEDAEVVIVKIVGVKAIVSVVDTPTTK